MTALRAGLETAKSAIISGGYDQAIVWCEHILKHYPKHVETYSLLAEAYREKGQLEQAEELCELVLSATPDNLIARWGLALIAEERNDPEEAAWHLERALEYNPGHRELEGELQRLTGSLPYLTPAGLGHLYLRGGLYNRAADQFQMALDVDGEHLEFMVALMEALFLARRYAEADDLSQRILADSPDCLKANLVAALIRLASPERASQAARYLMRAQQIEPGNHTLLALAQEAGLDRRVQLPSPAEIDLPALPAQPPEPTDLPLSQEPALAGRWVDDAQSLTLDWLNDPVLAGALGPELATDGTGAEELASPDDVTSADDTISPLDGFAPAEPAPLAPAGAETSDTDDAWMYGPTDLPSMLDALDESTPAPEPVRTGVESWQSLTEDIVGAARAEPASVTADDTSDEFPTIDQVRSNWGDEWADLLAEEVELDPEAEQRLSQALSDLIGETEPTSDTDWQIVRPGTIAQQRQAANQMLEELWPAEDEEPAQTFEQTSAQHEASEEAIQADEADIDELPSPQATETKPDPVIVEPLLRRLEDNPDDHAARLELANAYQLAGDPDASAAEYRRLIREAPELAPQMLESLRLLAHNWPNCASAHRVLGDVYMKVGMFQQAIEEYNWVLNRRQPQARGE